MGDCLITKLKSNIQDVNVPKLGDIIIKLPIVVDTYAKIRGSGEGTSTQITATIIQGGLFVDTNTEEIKTKGFGADVSIMTNIPSTISISKKYNLYRFQVEKAELNLDDFAESSKLEFLECPSCTLSGSFKNLPKSIAVLTILKSSPSADFNVSDLSHISRLETVNLSNSNAYGNIESLSILTGYLNSLNLSNCSNTEGDINIAFPSSVPIKKLTISNCKNITGSISQFLKDHPNATIIYDGSGVVN